MATETTPNNKPAAAPAAAEPQLRDPIIIDMGKKKRRQVRKLRKGREGSLMDRVKAALEDAIASKAIPANSQPVIVVVKEKKKKRKLGKVWGLG